MGRIWSNGSGIPINATNLNALESDLTSAAKPWKASTSYSAGQAILDPNGILVTANAAHTSGSSYDPTYWTHRQLLPTGSVFGAKTLVNRTNGNAYCIGVDTQNPNGSIWFADSTNGVLVQSDDGNQTQGNKAFPTGVNATTVSRIVKFNGMSVVALLAKDTTDGKTKVWTAPYTNQSTAFTWTLALTLTTGSAPFMGSLEVSNWGHDERVIVTEYGDPTGGPSVYISSNGTTFSKVYGPDSSMRHIHHAAFDPYNAGTIWMTCGDGIAKTIMQSTDYGSTWNTVVSSSEFQGVELSFSRDWVFLAGDSRIGTVMVIDRATQTPRWAALNYHHDIPPLKGSTRGIKTVTTLSLTSGSTTATTTGEFVADDQGRYLTTSPGNLPLDVYITAVNPPNTATLNRAATGTGSALTGYLSADQYYNNAYYGAVDPATGVYYCVANDTSNAGKLQGMFYLARPGGRVEILEPGGFNINLNGFVFIYRGRVWSGQWSRPLLSVG